MRGKTDVLQTEYFRRVGWVVLVKALTEFEFRSEGSDQIEIFCSGSENLRVKKGNTSVVLKLETF